MDIKHQIEELKMAYVANPSFEKLAELRAVMVAAQDANNASDGFRRLLTDLYPDTAHFIYELLQNAQDASRNNVLSSKVTFILSNDKLEFEHYGEKLFDVADIDAITSLGVSTKRDDNTSIGKFGVGFKSVFAYSNTPEIHSGDKHFKIENLFVPTNDGVEFLPTDNKTVFVLPFNNPAKDKNKAIYEIEQELRGLGTETLLFLKNINTIEYLLPDGNTLGNMSCMRLYNSDENIIKISVKTPGQDNTASFWLRYTRERVPIVDETGKSIECTIAIAFKLEKDISKEHRANWKIVACNQGKVCIFFPAEKETSNLHFYIHAPFASTVARDSVRKCEANEALRDAIAELVVDSLADIKRRNLMAVDFLGILPIAQDNLLPFYEPILTKIISAFQNQPLLPTKSNSYAPSNALFRGPAAISDVIGDEDLAFLTGHELPLWAKNAPQQNQREDRFLNSLDIDEWSWKELHATFNPENDIDFKKIENWVSRKPDEWLMRLYALLNNENRSELGNVSSSLRIVRTTKGEHVKAFEAYFIPNNSEEMPSELNFVKPEVYKTGDAEKRKKDAEAFLDILGVKRYNEREKVSLRLKRYRGENLITIDEQYWEDIQCFFDYSSKHPSDVATFQNEKFLMGEHGSKKYWVSSRQLRIITQETKAEVTEIDDLLMNYYAVWNGYKDKFGKNTYTEFYEFLKRIGVQEYTHDGLMRIRANRYNTANPNVTQKQHLRDMKAFLDYPQGEEFLKKKYFVLGADNEYHTADTLSIYLMSCLERIHKITKVSDMYIGMKEDLERLIEKMGGNSKLKIIAKEKSCEIDYTIEHLRDYLNDKSCNVIVAMLIMKAITDKNECQQLNYLYKYVRRDGRCNWKCSYLDSTLVTLLRSTAWLPDRTGNLYFPCDISKENLHLDINKYVGEFDDDTPLLKAIGFGKNVRQRQIYEDSQREQEQAEETRRNEALQELGLDKEDLDTLSKIREAEGEGIDVDEAFARERERRQKQEHRRYSFPQRSSSNPAVRFTNTKKQYADSVAVKYEPRMRNVRASSDSIDKQTYLRDMYTNDDDEMICQICKEEMPFKKRNGEYYFESVQLWAPSDGEKEYEAKYLALCPVCAAKYKEFISRGQKEESFRNAVQNCDDLEVPVELGNESATVSFVEKHLIDLQAIIKSNLGLAE